MIVVMTSEYFSPRCRYERSNVEDGPTGTANEAPHRTSSRRWVDCGALPPSQAACPLDGPQAPFRLVSVFILIFIFSCDNWVCHEIPQARSIHIEIMRGTRSYLSCSSRSASGWRLFNMRYGIRFRARRSPTPPPPRLGRDGSCFSTFLLVSIRMAKVVYQDGNLLHYRAYPSRKHLPLLQPPAAVAAAPTVPIIASGCLPVRSDVRSLAPRSLPLSSCSLPYYRPYLIACRV